jgi:hypothetical protein
MNKVNEELRESQYSALLDKKKIYEKNVKSQEKRLEKIKMTLLEVEKTIKSYGMKCKNCKIELEQDKIYKMKEEYIYYCRPCFLAIF